MYVYAVIPLIVAASAGLLFTSWLTLQVLGSFRPGKISLTLSLFGMYGLLAWAAVEFKIIENALATILTLSAALLSRAMSLSESYAGYQQLLKDPERSPASVRGLASRFTEITPDIVLVVLLLVMARDIRERYALHDAATALIYAIEFLYAAVLFAYIGIGDMTGEILRERNKGKRLR